MTIHVVVGIVQRAEKVLMVKRAKQEGILDWVFPGGKVEKGETLENACIREVKEETGVDISVVTKIGERRHPNTNRIITYFWCDYIDGEEKIINSDEIVSVEFKSKEQFEKDVKTDIYPAVLEFLGWKK